ncbi:hypothetical protein MTR67_019331 [Solanum verrucosum]|uniref:DUF4283 domain-containing protein n=1 Tax=Solanum verrucosum TaxID=315347 RepID=A0AAF0QSK5_SOLVR|nr:hypothetical protein MTR67_019331 [Solanum verrucosum]
MKPIVFLHGETRVIWEEEEVEQMIIKENLEFAVVGKFSYGWPEIQELRKLIPKQCELKAECNVGVLSNRHILIRASCLEDYVNLLSKPTFYIAHRGWMYPMRTLKWEPMFDPEEETSTTIAWISFPCLPPNFFVNEAVFFISNCSGKEQGSDKEQQTRRDGGWIKHGWGKVEQVWNKKSIQVETWGINMKNKFKALESQIDDVEGHEGQLQNEKGSGTKRWVEEVFMENKKDGKYESMSEGVEEDKEAATRGGDIDGESRSDIGGNKGKEKQGESDARSYNMNNKTREVNNEVCELNKEEDSVSKQEEIEESHQKRILDLEELSEEEKQKRKDTEDEEIEENIDSIAKEGDLSPRQIKQLESAAKRNKLSQSSLPLQVQARSSRERVDTISQ